MMYKPTDELERQLLRYLKRHWPEDVVTPGAFWPHKLSVGRFTSAEDWDIACTRIDELTSWAAAHGLDLAWRNQRVYGTTQRVPTHLIAATLDDSLRLAPEDVRRSVANARRRVGTLRRLTDPTSQLVKEVADLPDVDMDIAVAVAEWVRDHDTAGLTPRQVPIPGVHGKFLERHRGLIQLLSGKDDLGLTSGPRHRTVLRYVDPHHLASGGREFDMHVAGDHPTLPYTPTVVLVCENQDTALHFPQTPGGLVIEGGGFAAARTLATLPWLPDVPRVLYWGDLDASGFEIVHAVRQSGVHIDTVLMDRNTYDTYQRFGSATDRRSQQLRPRTPKDLPLLTPPERDMYELLCSDACPGHRRIEQERIPLVDAHDHISEVVALAGR